MNAITFDRAGMTGRTQHVFYRQASLDIARFRVLWIAIGFVALACIALMRVFFLGISDRAESARAFDDILVPERGEIVDRNGVTLARAFPSYSLWFNPAAMGDVAHPLVKAPADIARRICQIFPDLDYDTVLARLVSGKSGYIRKRILPEDANKIQDLGELALEIPREVDRHYPQGMLAAHVLGFVDSTGTGKVGMEAVLDKQLVDPNRRADAVALSIDVRVQGALEDELRRGMLLTDAKGAAGVVLDSDTGEVMALASLPEFDPNNIDAQGQQHMFNQVTNQVYELGSTFKPITIAAAIDAGVVRNFAKAYDARPVKMGRFTIKDSHDLGASLTVPEALIHSSNNVTARIADELGGEKLRAAFIKLGMNERAHIELPARGYPIWPGEKWSRLRTMTASYGHGIAVTPLHLASAYAALVNGGIWRPATMYKVDPLKVQAGRRVFKASTSSRVRQLLRMVSKYGTGKSADAAGFRVGGKTGSAEKPGKAGYNKTSVVATFAAAFPMDRPRYVVIAMLDEPKGTTASSYQRTAAFNAAPIVGNLVPRIAPLLGIMPDTSRDVDISDLRPLVREGDE